MDVPALFPPGWNPIVTPLVLISGQGIHEWESEGKSCALAYSELDWRPHSPSAAAQPGPSPGPTAITPARTGRASAFHSSARTPSVSGRSEEHTSELQSLMRNSYAVFCLKK